jgi:hypothetical protein
MSHAGVRCGKLLATPWNHYIHTTFNQANRHERRILGDTNKTQVNIRFLTAKLMQDLQRTPVQNKVQHAVKNHLINEVQQWSTKRINTGNPQVNRAQWQTFLAQQQPALIALKAGQPSGQRLMQWG